MCITRNTNNLDSCGKANKCVSIVQRSNENNSWISRWKEDWNATNAQCIYLLYLMLTSKVLWNFLSQPSFLQILLGEWEMINYWNMRKHAWKWRIWGKNRDHSKSQYLVWPPGITVVLKNEAAASVRWYYIVDKNFLFCIHNFINVDKISSSTD